MNEKARRMGHLTFALILLLTCLCGAHGQEQKLKQWELPIAHGTISGDLTRVVRDDGKAYLVLSVASLQGNVAIADQVNFFATALNDMQRMNFDMRSLTMIFTRLEGEAPQVERVGTYAANQRGWGAASRSRNAREIYPRVTDFLNKSGAYREWDEQLRPYGLKLMVAGVEKVYLEPFSKSGAVCPNGVNCPGIRVPTGAMVQINVVGAAHE